MLKKAALGKKLLILVFASLCGLYVCWIGVNGKLSRQISKKGAATTDLNMCSKVSILDLNTTFRHYPRPRTYDRGHCVCTPVHYFVILSMQRSGSGWFETLLNSHPNISSHGEVFSVKKRRAQMSEISKTLDKIYNLDWSSSASKNECTAAVGLKWMLNQGVMEYHMEISNYFMKRGVSVIFLLRRNSLKRLVSVLSNAYDRKAKLLNGTHKSHVHSEEEADRLASYLPTIDTSLVVANMQRVEEITNDALQFFNRSQHIVVYYEDLLKGKKVLKKVQEFLDVPVRKLGSQQVKIHRKPLRYQIENWDEVLKRLKGTKYERFMKDSDYKG